MLRRYTQSNRVRLKTYERNFSEGRLASLWAPGALWSPPARRQLDLSEEYRSVLESAVRQNQIKLASHYGLASEPESNRTLRTIIHRLGQELYAPSLTHPDPRFKPAKPHASTKQYNRFLKALYSEQSDLDTVMAQVAKLPQPSMLYIQPAHMTDLMILSRSQIHSQSYLQFYDQLELIQFPFSSIERAQILLAMSKTGGPVSESFKSWRPLFSHGDIAILNILFMVALNSSSPEIQYFTVNEMATQQIAPDRFTYECLFKQAENEPEKLKILFRKFCDQGLVIDISILKQLTRAFLKSGHPETAESLLDQINKIQPTLSVSKQNNHRHWALLWQIDRAQKLAGEGKELSHIVSIVPDEEIFLQFAYYYLRNAEFHKFAKILKAMANFGYLNTDILYAACAKFAKHKVWAKEDFVMLVYLLRDIAIDLGVPQNDLLARLEHVKEQIGAEMPSVYDLFNA